MPIRNLFTYVALTLLTSCAATTPRVPAADPKTGTLQLQERHSRDPNTRCPSGTARAQDGSCRQPVRPMRK